MDFQGRTIFITGSARGIGQALAVALAEAGGTIIGCDLHAQTETKTKLGDAYHELIGDVSDPKDAQRLVAEAIEIGFSVLINNAGVAPSGDYAQTDFARWKTAIDVNVTGLMAITHAALPHLLAQPSAKIVNLSSVAGCVGAPGMAAYCASKHAVAGFTSALDLELDGTGLSVMSVHPSMARTRMIDGVAEPKLLPIIEPDDVVQAILKGIRRDKRRVFVPGRMRALVDVLPRLFPHITRRTLLADPNARGWLHADKRIPKS
jgi:all-trans-retinol dehydrogenase (NAD+)